MYEFFTKSNTTNRVVKIVFRPYQEESMRIIENEDRVILCYGRQMGSSTVAMKCAYDFIIQNKKVLVINVRENSNTIIRTELKYNNIGFADTRIKYSTCGRRLLDETQRSEFLNQFDLIIIMEPHFIQDTLFQELVHNLDNYHNKVIMVNSGFDDRNSTFLSMVLDPSNIYSKHICPIQVCGKVTSSKRGNLIKKYGIDRYYREFQLSPLYPIFQHI